MIISQTPFRISFFGGGTDYPAWYRENGGAVLSTTIDKYCYITARHLPPFFEHIHRIVYSIIECVNETKDIQHPAVRAAFDVLSVREGLEIHYDGDMPARSGIGSSSSFTVGLLHALFALRGQAKSKKELADMAIDIEQNIIKETVGSQDQVAAAYGGLNRIDFTPSGQFLVKPLVIHPQRAAQLNARLMLFFTGFSRIAERVAKSKVQNFKDKHSELKTIYSFVDQAESILQSAHADLDDFGRMLHESWRLKRTLSNEVSTALIDEIYETAMRNGAIGGKILGAGGGGFVLFYVPEHLQKQVRTALPGLVEVDFQFESGGSQIILYNPDRAIFRRSWQKRELQQESNFTQQLRV